MNSALEKKRRVSEPRVDLRFEDRLPTRREDAFHPRIQPERYYPANDQARRPLPEFSGRPRTRSRAYFLAPLLTGKLRTDFVVGTVAWAASFVFFWIWWLKPSHNVNLLAYVTVSLLQLWATLLPAYFLMVFLRARKPAGALSLPAGSRVAMVVTKAPSEPFSVVRQTLEAMLDQDYPHDTWLADEDPSPQTLNWCARNGVFVSTRRHVEAYHRKEWPRRTRCKEGNLAFFYDRYGYANYTFVSQLDADHIPEPGYLRQMLRPFSDPDVGYVSAPSLCDKNAVESWSARGRLYGEATMHGALQVGYNAGWAPLCIGSHYAVRTEALYEIGGLGPELAEDHSTTLLMNAFGWRGVHALDAVATGDGPRTFADLITQEFQWSRSLVTILLKYTPRYLAHLPPRLKFQFLFSQLWYPLFAIFMLACFVLPIIAIFAGSPLVGITYPGFILHALPMAMVLTFLVIQLRRAGLMRPVDAPVFSWEVPVFLFAKWPWILAGSIAAVQDVITGTHVNFRVTPKGAADVDPVPTRVIAPYLVLSAVSALPVIFVHNAAFGSGFYLFALVNALIYAAVTVIILVKHQIENCVRRARPGHRAMIAASLLFVMVLQGAGAWQNGLRGLDGITFGMPFVAITERTFPVAGAGQGGQGVWTVKFNPRWTWPDRQTMKDFELEYAKWFSADSV